MSTLQVLTLRREKRWRCGAGPKAHALRPVIAIASVLAVAVLPARGQPVIDESPDAYEIVTATSAGVVPPPLRAFLAAHLDALRRSATEGLSATSETDTLFGEPGNHYVMLDVAAAEGDSEARYAAARKFPRNRAAAVKLARMHGRRNGGSLPWVILERYASLVRALRDGQVETIVREAGILLHFVTDAALPFNTTVQRDGVASGCVHWTASSGHGRASLPNHTVRHRCHIGLLSRLRSRLEHEVRVAPQRYRFLSHPSRAVFDLLLESHRVTAGLRSVDTGTTAELGIVDADTFAAESDAYYGRVSRRAASIMETQLEEAALLGANLIGTAWVEAGSPSPDEWAAAVPEAEESPPPPAEEAETEYVGTRNSTVFHLATCPHARRIRPENLVRFDSAEQAIAAGRKPCKACRPEGP